MKEYEIITYDVWGNKRDGLQVNNRIKTGCRIELTDETTGKEIINALKNHGVIKSHCRHSSFDVEGDDQMIFVEYIPDCGFPVAELQLV